VRRSRTRSTSIAAVVRDLAIAATEANEVTVFDPTAVVWWVEFGAPQPTPNAADGADCGNIRPLGITGMPVIDVARGTLYLDATIRDNNSTHRCIFAPSVDGSSPRSNWCVDVGIEPGAGAWTPGGASSGGASVFTASSPAI
jgi:hypothetical protein